ncbi:MAG: 2-phosphosulfolactate phosphatase [Verrucomicrobiota bacterium]
MLFDAALSPAEIDLIPSQNLPGTVCVVFDVLRATSSIITGLAHGTQEVRPVLSIEEALAARAEWPDAILGGERHGDRIEGFDLGNSPLEYCRPGLRRIITTTTNGTVALRACASAQGVLQVLAGALLNMKALEEYIREASPERVLLVCAGTFRDLGLEDVIAAGMLAAAFPNAEMTDAAQVALAAYTRHSADLLAGLKHATNGRVLYQRGRAADVEWCAQVSCFNLVGVMDDGVIRVAE